MSVGVSEWVSECVNECGSEFVSEFVSEWASEWVREWVSVWMSESVNEWEKNAQKCTQVCIFFSCVRKHSLYFCDVCACERENTRLGQTQREGKNIKRNQTRARTRCGKNIKRAREMARIWLMLLLLLCKEWSSSFAGSSISSNYRVTAKATERKTEWMFIHRYLFISYRPHLYKWTYKCEMKYT